MKVILCSDLHGRAEYLDALLAEQVAADGIVFCGDGYRDFVNTYQRPTQFRLAVAGNCDFELNAPKTLIMEFEGVKTLITHGDRYGAKSGVTGLVAAAKKEGCAAVLYGHTHAAKVSKVDGITLVCGGALKNGEYAVLNFQNGRITAKLENL